jgi:hypothetical protein
MRPIPPRCFFRSCELAGGGCDAIVRTQTRTGRAHTVSNRPRRPLQRREELLQLSRRACRPNASHFCVCGLPCDRLECLCRLITIKQIQKKNVVLKLRGGGRVCVCVCLFIREWGVGVAGGEMLRKSATCGVQGGKCIPLLRPTSFIHSGQPFSLAHCNSSRWSPSAGNLHVPSSHGQPFSLAHCSTSR